MAEADRLWAELTQANSALAAGLREMQNLAGQSNKTLEALAMAQATQTNATAAANKAATELDEVEARLSRARTLLRDWAFQAYAEGGDAQMLAFLDALQTPESEVGDPVGDLAYLTDQRTRAVKDLNTLTARQKTLTAIRQKAQAQATAAAETVKKQKAALDAALAVQKTKLAQLQQANSAELSSATPLIASLAGIQTPAAKAAYTRLMDALKGAGMSVDVGTPCQADNPFYPNGLFPASALCPLWQAPGESLQPRAAAGFDAMSKAYAAQFGGPICVTDSYRSLSEQFAIKRTRGAFAATPGTSRHGLGRALDLCGGINSFSSPNHAWMIQNAPLYGWFQPAWAGPGGATPEPWHFEFAG